MDFHLINTLLYIRNHSRNQASKNGRLFRTFLQKSDYVTINQ